ncbi:OPT oligopeptide transporter protein-domain-containing protein [Tirmania nivea]|nr:OPT oligopeptide transporter protein-domain-containing protein [Tirmania nivea]
MTDQSAHGVGHELTDHSTQYLRHRSARNSTSTTATGVGDESPQLEQTYTQVLDEAERIASNDRDKEGIKDDGESVFSSLRDLDIHQFAPFPIEPHLTEEKNVLTFRAVFIGCLLGALVNASNVYLGLKTGWTFSANMFGAIFGFAFLKFCSRTFAENFPLLGGNFGPKENAIAQTAATAAGGFGGIFVSAIPALYQQKLLGATPMEDFKRLLTFTIVSAYYGLLFATPLRKFFIIYVARELKLIFPTATATAMTIRSMHAIGSNAGAAAKQRTRALAITFSGSLIWRVVSQYAPGILWDWHIFLWFYQWSGYTNGAIHVDNWGWFIEWTPAFIGTGLLVGLNPAISFFGGSVLAWGIIGPALVHAGICHGSPPYDSADNPKWNKVMSFTSFNLDDAKNSPSPRYWLLWPGVLVMITTSFTELGVQYKLIWHAFKCAWRAMAIGTNDIAKRRIGRSIKILEKSERIDTDEFHVDDIAGPEEQVAMWMWAPPLAACIIVTCIILGLQYHLNVGMSVLAILLGFIFAFLAIQCTGATDITPLTTAAKATQLVLGGAASGQGYSQSLSQRLNLIGGAIASGAASQATDLVVDFRVGFLLRTPPRQQWIAQALGSIVAVFIAPGMFILFVKAYPCVIDLTKSHCQFSAPSVAAWRAVALAVTEKTFPVPKTSAIFALMFGLLGSISVLVRHYYLVGHRDQYRVYMPNFMAVGLAFVLSQTVYGTAMLMGALIAYFWARKYPVGFDTYCYAVAAGGIAGEGMGGVVNAVFQISGIAGANGRGTAIGCPYDLMC